MIDYVWQTQGMPSNPAGMNEFWVRALLFLFGLFIFVMLCGLAWRYIPALRNLVNYNPHPSVPPLTDDSDEVATAPKISDAMVTYAKPVALTEPNEGLIAPTDTKPNPRPLPAEFLQDYLARGEGGAVHNEIEAAIADGRPGTVVRAASDLNGVASNSPIVIVHRED